MDSAIKCMPFPLNWKGELMSFKVKIMRKVLLSDHVKEIGVASVVLERLSDSIFGGEYVFELKYVDIEWLEEHEGFKVTDDDLLKVCTEVAEKIWDE